MNASNGTKTAIITATKLCTDVSDNITWTEINKSEKQQLPIPREKGERPYQFEIDNKQLPSVNQNSIQRSSKKMKNMDQKHLQPSQIPNFSQIIPSVRQINGGWNTLSNEAIEKRHRERQLQYAKEREESNLNSSGSSKATFTTANSETSGSYKTTLQDSYELKKLNQQETSEKSTDTNLERYKKNALITGLLRDEQYHNIESNDVAGALADTLNISETADSFEDKRWKVETKDDKEAMRDDRMVMFFQSQEDEDVYYHPLKERIKMDPDWQNQRLKRKGIETTVSPRQYFMALDDDCFTFKQK